MKGLAYSCISIMVIMTLGLITLIILFNSIDDSNDRKLTKSSMFHHYYSNSSEFTSVMSQIDKMTNFARISIEFEEDAVQIFHTKLHDEYSSNWPRGKENIVDSISRSIDLSEYQLDEISALLRSIDCIGYSNIQNQERTFNYARQKFSIYNYVIVKDTVKMIEYSKGDYQCNFIQCTNNVYLEYLGGAIGSQCFSSNFREN